ncbi:MAG: hypothetical protein M1834_006486 [Cirrosporium novae-zelandiae]|nr:MAG: hypothetical protein M1834_006486 [Cirrosporium novae-zelandiae]
MSGGNHIPSRKSFDSSHSSRSNRSGKTRSPEPMISTGRGGAGNIGSPKLVPQANDPASLPTLKATNYTTGRGGTGNFRLNDPEHPEIAREAQDIKLHPRRMSENYHEGRGGAGNVRKMSEAEKGEAKKWNRKVEDAMRREEEAKERAKGKTWAAKSKEVIGAIFQ